MTVDSFRLLVTGFCYRKTHLYMNCNLSDNAPIIFSLLVENRWFALTGRNCSIVTILAYRPSVDN